MSGIPSRREARRARDREDFVRATQARVPAKLRADAGKYAGPTHRERLEDELATMVAKYKAAQARGDDDKARTARGIIRGLAMALALYENSYDYTTQQIVKIEKGFME